MPCRISGTDIKDKTSLVEARKNVEKQMERFKVCEKETKTKMFSKEGLAQAQKQDPREKARNEAREWINTTVDNLTAEVCSARRPSPFTRAYTVVLSLRKLKSWSAACYLLF